MFDNLRDDSNTFYESDGTSFNATAGNIDSGYSGYSKPRRFLGMTSFQRFVIAFMLMLAVCILGAACLLVTGKIGF